MEADRKANGECGCFARCIREFLNHFQVSPVANAMKAERWWANRSKVLDDENDLKELVSVNHQTSSGLQKLLLKASAGRGRKREPWIKWLCGEVVEHFNLYQKAGVKFSSKLLQQMTMNILSSSKKERFSQETITLCWIQRLVEAKDIIGRHKTENSWLALNNR